MSEERTNCFEPTGSRDYKQLWLYYQKFVKAHGCSSITNAITQRDNAIEALKYCRELLDEALRDEINIADETEKWDREYGHLISENDRGQARR